MVFIGKCSSEFLDQGEQSRALVEMGVLECINKRVNYLVVLLIPNLLENFK